MLRPRRVPQPPVDPLRRAGECPDFWPAALLALIACLLLFTGSRHLTRLDTVDGNSASEPQLVKAFARGGLEFQQAPPPLNPAALSNPTAAATAMNQAARIADLPLRHRYRVNTGAADPCPT